MSSWGQGFARTRYCVISPRTDPIAFSSDLGNVLAPFYAAGQGVEELDQDSEILRYPSSTGSAPAPQSPERVLGPVGPSVPISTAMDLGEIET